MDDVAWMKEAISEARKALPADSPVGAVLVLGDVIVGRGHNMVEALCDPTRHAEMIAIEEASSAVGRASLACATMFVTLEPCPMCAGAIVLSRIRRVVFGASDERQGAVKSLYTILSDSRLCHQVVVKGGVLDDECRSLLQDFFRSLRQQER
jgi:tRNA(adenine34) deaminase